MDLTNVRAWTRANGDIQLQPGDQFVSGGTWLFSAPHPEVQRLVDVSDGSVETNWDADRGLLIPAATRLGGLSRWSVASPLPAAGLFAEAIAGLSSSWKVIERSTVGGNIALALAKGALTPVCMALDGRYRLEDAAGAQRWVDAGAFQLGSQRTVLRPQERVSAVEIPAASMARRWALERVRMTAGSHVVASVIGTLDSHDAQLSLVISAVLVRPVRLRFDTLPRQFSEVRDALDTVLQGGNYMADQHGSARYRHAMARYLAERVYQSLQAS